MPSTTEPAVPVETSPLAASEGQNLRWYQGVDRYAWTILAIAALGWLFDTMDQHIFTLVRTSSLKDILQETVPSEELNAAAQELGGKITAVFLIGWAVGGFAFGMIGDKLGRAPWRSPSSSTPPSPA
jgi:MFS family permease